MRVLAAILITTCSCLAEPTIQPVRNIVACAWTLGPAKCFNALGAWRAEKALTNPDLRTKLSEDLLQFPWKKYRNSSEEELHSQLCDETERLLQRKSLSLTMLPGYRFELLSKGNGTLNVDVYKDVDSGSERGMKKAKKKFYQILPLLVVPGLIMSAILPFVLPGLKMMTLMAGFLNSMALNGAIFTLLRNNAFNDKYEHKVIYVNEGYKNEKKHQNFEHQHGGYENYDGTNDEIIIEEDAGVTHIEEPVHYDWSDHQHYKPSFHVEDYQIPGNKLKRSSKIQIIPKSK